MNRLAIRSLVLVLAAAALLAAPAAPLRAQRQPPAIPAGANYTAADVAFMQGMIGHHAQALTMSALVAERSTTPAMALLAERITVSQQDEIAIMRRWLVERQQTVPSVGAGHDAHAMHAMHGAAGATARAMPGMLTPAQIDSLVAARGTAFDRLFLRYMIQHHEGALTMVTDLLKTPGAARDPMVFQFVSDVDTDQRAEIRRMQALLTSLP
ncbi:MAG: DUF305 domain-containing protein [Gemmatimonas sp.]|jgi:uncharacterized protein (DUF305 family)|uniref:DUF305 domain-containing protein n=1 Tax=Gemmatimonas sp. TaxID=1962908 RepID=UPI00391EF160|nr:DUF305 domain-containing protein [Gemmatimonadota bacterium]